MLRHVWLQSQPDVQTTPVGSFPTRRRLADFFFFQLLKIFLLAWGSRPNTHAPLPPASCACWSPSRTPPPFLLVETAVTKFFLAQKMIFADHPRTATHLLAWLIPMAPLWRSRPLAILTALPWLLLQPATPWSHLPALLWSHPPFLLQVQ